MEGNLVVNYGNLEVRTASLASRRIALNSLSALAIPVDAAIIEMSAFPSGIVGASHICHGPIIARYGGLSNGSHFTG